MVLVFLISILLVVVMVYRIIGLPVRYTPHEKEILRHAVVAQAKIISIEYTGKKQKLHPEITFQLDVFTASGEPYKTESTTFVSVYKLSKFIPDSIISVKYDPKNKKTVVIEKEFK